MENEPSSNKSQKWYKTTVGIITLLILFFPAGLFLMWKYTQWNKKVKWIITAIFIALVFITIVGGNSSQNITPTKQESSPTQTSEVTQDVINTASTPNPKPTVLPSPTPIPTATPQPKAQYDWSSYRASRIKDLKAALKITEDQVTFYKNELDKLIKNYNQITSLYQSGSITQSEFESTSKKFIEADNFIRTTLRELAKDADTLTNLIRRFENGENISPAEEKAIRGI